MKQYNDILWCKTWWLMLKGFDANTRDEVFCAVNRYAFDGILTDGMQPRSEGLFLAIKAGIDIEKERYEIIREKRSEAGKIGNAKRWGEKQENVANVTNATSDGKISQTSQTSQQSQVSPLFIQDNSNTSFLPSAHARENEERKEEFLIEISKELLRRGSTEPRKEAEAYWAYNADNGWRMKNKKPIADPVSWAAKWKMQFPTSEGVKRYAQVYIDLIRAAKLDKNIEVVDGLSSITSDGTNVVITFKSEYVCNIFMARENDKESLQMMMIVMDMHFNGQRLSYDVKH